MSKELKVVDLTMWSSGHGWCGTFAQVVLSLFEDLLSDGAPVLARIHYEDEEGVMQVVTDHVVEVTWPRSLLRLTGGEGGHEAIDAWDIRKVEV